LALAAPGAAALTTLGAWGMARRMVTNRRPAGRYITPWELGIPYEDVEFSTPDGVTLRGWWLDRPGAPRTVITLAGHHGVRSDTLGIGAALWRRGANVLLFDFRGRGGSEWHINTLGYYETTDALTAIEWAHAREPGARIGLVGYSMGGAVSIMAAARDPRVAAVVADSPFASQRQVLRRWFRRNLKLPTYPLVRLMEEFLPYEIEQVEPIREVARIAPRALMLIHGALDAVTNPQDSAALYEAAGEPKVMWALPSVGHCDAYFVDRTAYAERVSAFLEEHL
jgi:dipeptidyl aminopeptidase/acylaminoacyl peptidase